MKKINFDNKLYYTLIISIIFLAYYSSLNFHFVWDDYPLIVENEFLKNNIKWYKLFFHNFWHLGSNITDPTRSFYRPIISISYLVDYNIWGLNPYGFHLSNIIFHIINSLLIFKILLFLLKNNLFAFIGSLLFALHPTHIENICWISGRTDLICGVFFFSAFYLFLKWSKNNKNSLIIYCSILYFLSLLSKENALIFPIIIFVYYIFLDRKTNPFKNIYKFGISFLIITAFYLFLRNIALSNINIFLNTHSFSKIFLSFFMVFNRYLTLLFFIYPGIDVHHSDKFISHPFSLSMLFYFITFIIFYYLIKYFYIKKSNISFYLLWIFITLIPVFNLGTFGDILYADRFLYIPSFGYVCIILSVIIYLKNKYSNRFQYFNNIIYISLLLFLLFFTLIIKNVSYVWKNDIQLFKTATLTSKKSPYIYFRLGSAFDRYGLYIKAIYAYNKTIELDPEFIDAYINKSICLKNIKNYKKALKTITKAIELNNIKGYNNYTQFLIFYNTANILRHLNQFEKAATFYKISLKLNNHPLIHKYLNVCLNKLI